MTANTFDLTFIILPLLVDGVILFTAGLLSGKRWLVLIAFLAYLTVNIGIPSYIVVTYESDQKLAGFFLIVFFRFLELFALRLGQLFVLMWQGNKTRGIENKLLIPRKVTLDQKRYRNTLVIIFTFVIIASISLVLLRNLDVKITKATPLDNFFALFILSMLGTASGLFTWIGRKTMAKGKFLSRLAMTLLLLGLAFYFLVEIIFLK